MRELLIHRAEAQWLILADDLDKHAERTFALKDFRQPVRTDPQGQAL